MKVFGYTRRVVIDTNVLVSALLVTHNIKHYPVTEWRTMIWELL